MAGAAAAAPMKHRRESAPASYLFMSPPDDLPRRIALLKLNLAGLATRGHACCEFLAARKSDKMQYGQEKSNCGSDRDLL
jgi:hypothetical protein